MQIWTKLKLLMWKNYILRKRHWLLTLIQLTYPVVFFMMMPFFYRMDYLPHQINKEYNRKITRKNLYDLFNNECTIFFTPVNDNTRYIMDKINLLLKPADIHSFESRNELNERVRLRGSSFTPLISVIFLKSNYKALRFVIRPLEPKAQWRIAKNVYESGITQPGSGSHDYIRNSFLPLLMAIPTIHLNRVRRVSVKYSIEEYPHPFHSIEISDKFADAYSFVSMLSCCFLCSNVVHRIVEDKKSGIKELMKMTGLQSWLLRVGWLLYVFMVHAITFLFITIYLQAPLWNPLMPSVKYTSFGILFFLLITYVAVAVSFSFAISSFFTNPLPASVVGLTIWLMSYFLPMTLINRDVSTKTNRLFFRLFPSITLYFGLDIVKIYEKNKVGVHWNNWNNYPLGEYSDFKISSVFAVFIFHIIIYMSVAIYADRVFPGPYGIKESFFFLCKNIHYNLFVKDNEPQYDLSTLPSGFKIEKEYLLPVGIRIRNLYKIFGSTVAINDVSFDIYKGQITGLIGQNRAGKTSIISVIAGMLSADNGRVQVLGLDINFHLTKIRSNLGICPENNLLFGELSVVEQLMFFGMLKRLSRKKAEEEALYLLQRFNLYNERYLLKSQLSDGTRRKLAIAIAIIGNPTVLLLDEPTIGLDPVSCRIIWNVLLSLKKPNSVILFSTQSMEEADILADRIAILNRGFLVCYGTPVFIMKEFGNDYQLSMVFDKMGVNTFQRKQIISLIKNIIPLASLSTVDKNSLIFSLPEYFKDLFPALLNKLENSRNELHIVNMTLSFATISDIYFRMSNIMSGGRFVSIDEEKISRRLSVAITTKVTGMEQIVSQYTALFQKHYWTERRKYHNILSLVFFTVIFTLITLYCSDMKRNKLNFVRLDPKLYDKSKIYYSASYTRKNQAYYMGWTYRRLVKNFAREIFHVEDIRKTVLSEGQHNIEFYKRHLLFGAEFNKTKSQIVHVNAMYGVNAIHAAPISLILALQAVARIIFRQAIIIECINYPYLTEDSDDKNDFTPIKHLHTILAPALVFLIGHFLIRPVSERVTSVKYLQLMSGLHVINYWLANYIWDLIIFSIVTLTIIIMLLVYGMFSESCPYCGIKEIEVIAYTLTAYACSAIPYSYIFSLKCKHAKSISQFVLFNLFVGVASTVLIVYLRRTTGYISVYDLLSLIPQHGLFISIYYIDKQARSNYCEYRPLIRDECDEHFQSYFDGQLGVITNILLMLFSSCLYFTALILIELDFPFLRLKKLRNSYNELIVEKETISYENKQEEIEDTQSVNNETPDIFLLHDISKTFKKRQVIKNINFGAKQGECFGLLGANGSGKTTIFKMLSGDMLATTGNARIYQDKWFYYLSKYSRQYLNMIGYCPYKDIIINYLTGEEVLYFFGKIRGISEGLDDLVFMWIDRLGLSDISHILCKEYCRGDRRKLTVGIALIGDPLVILLDEPTSGLDPEGCRNLWNTLNNNLQQNINSCIIVGSQNPTECETLCTCVLIINYLFDTILSVGFLKSGQIVCRGTLSDLRNEYKKRFIVKLKINFSENLSLSDISLSARKLFTLTTTDDDKLMNLIADFAQEFDGESFLQDQHNTLLHYHVYQETLQWSEVYVKINTLQLRHPIVEGYIIAETFLEEVFLSLLQNEL